MNRPVLLADLHSPPHDHHMTVQRTFHPQPLVAIYKPNEDGKLGEPQHEEPFWGSNPVTPVQHANYYTIALLTNEDDDDDCVSGVQNITCPTLRLF
jgi:hypothetical protein